MNKALGRSTGNAEVADVLITNAAKLCKLTQGHGGDNAWECPERCDLWKKILACKS